VHGRHRLAVEAARRPDAAFWTVNVTGMPRRRLPKLGVTFTSSGAKVPSLFMSEVPSAATTANGLPATLVSLNPSLSPPCTGAVTVKSPGCVGRECRSGGDAARNGHDGGAPAECAGRTAGRRRESHAQTGDRGALRIDHLDHEAIGRLRRSGRSRE
jgi:hypothetical protein